MAPSQRGGGFKYNQKLIDCPTTLMPVLYQLSYLIMPVITLSHRFYRWTRMMINKLQGHLLPLWKLCDRDKASRWVPAHFSWSVVPIHDGLLSSSGGLPRVLAIACNTLESIRSHWPTTHKEVTYSCNYSLTCSMYCPAVMLCTL